jgi:hypothetical protein
VSDAAEVPGLDTGGTSARVNLGLSLEPPPQRRWTIAIRWILGVPLALAAVGIYVAAFFWLIGAWFSALVTGRVPDGLQRRLCGVLQFQARLSAYVNLLSDVWPGVHFQAREGDAAVVGVDHVDLRRSAVFFRAVLAIPAGIIASALSTGLYPFLVAMWVVGLIRGRTPRTLHQLAALSVRFSIRTAAFWFLVTPTQPFRGFFGDPVPRGVAAYRGPPGTTSPATAWVVGRPVKVLLVVAVALGLASQATNNRWNRLTFSLGAGPRDRSLVAQSDTSTEAIVASFRSASASCATVGCVSRAASGSAAAFVAAVSILEQGYITDRPAQARYAEYLSVLTSPQSIIVALSDPANSGARDQALRAKLVDESWDQRSFARALEARI